MKPMKKKYVILRSELKAGDFSPVKAKAVESGIAPIARDVVRIAAVLKKITL